MPEVSAQAVRDQRIRNIKRQEPLAGTLPHPRQALPEKDLILQAVPRDQLLQRLPTEDVVRGADLTYMGVHMDGMFRTNVKALRPSSKCFNYRLLFNLINLLNNY